MVNVDGTLLNREKWLRTQLGVIRIEGKIIKLQPSDGSKLSRPVIKKLLRNAIAVAGEALYKLEVRPFEVSRSIRRRLDHS